MCHKKAPTTVRAIYQSGRLDSNQRPLRPERSALPGCATARFIHRSLAKVEKGNHKNNDYPFKYCRVDWIRTSDHLHPMQVRYRAAPPPELYRYWEGKCTAESGNFKIENNALSSPLNEATH